MWAFLWCANTIPSRIDLIQNKCVYFSQGERERERVGEKHTQKRRRSNIYMWESGRLLVVERMRTTENGERERKRVSCVGDIFLVLSSFLGVSLPSLSLLYIVCFMDLPRHEGVETKWKRCQRRYAAEERERERERERTWEKRRGKTVRRRKGKKREMESESVNES